MPNLGKIETKSGVAYIDRPGFYFGYGSETDPAVVEGITSRSLIYETGVVAIARNLAVQEIDQIPDQETPELGDKSAQQIVADAWNAHTAEPFSSYVILPSENRSAAVQGTLYELTMDDVLGLVDWHLADPNLGRAAWRCWDHDIELTDGRQHISALTIRPGQDVDRNVPGVGYDPYLNDMNVTLKVISDFAKMRKADN